MSRAKNLVDAFFNAPVEVYRTAVVAIKRAGGLTKFEKDVVADAVGQKAAQCIFRHTDPNCPIEDEASLDMQRRSY